MQKKRYANHERILEMNSSSNWVIAVATACAAGASIAAAVAAYFSYRHEIYSEKQRQNHLKLEPAVRYTQELMITVGEIRALAEDEHVKDRGLKVREHAGNLRRLITVIGSLSPEAGKRLESWYIRKDMHGNSISQIIHNELGHVGGYMGEKHNSFFKEKSRDLREIQEFLFKSMSA